MLKLWVNLIGVCGRREQRPRRQIVSFRSCVRRAVGVSQVRSEGNFPAMCFYLLSFGAGVFILYLLGEGFPPSHRLPISFSWPHGYGSRRNHRVSNSGQSGRFCSTSLTSRNLVDDLPLPVSQVLMKISFKVIWIIAFTSYWHIDLLDAESMESNWYNEVGNHSRANSGASHLCSESVSSGNPVDGLPLAV